MKDLNDSELINMALNMWANHIETGQTHLSAKDAEASKQYFKALDSNQMALVIRLRNLGSGEIT